VDSVGLSVPSENKTGRKTYIACIQHTNRDSCAVGSPEQRNDRTPRAHATCNAANARLTQKKKRSLLRTGRYGSYSSRVRSTTVNVVVPG